ncbi:hypothetical protein ABVT39_021724 [Epinephelus coioides]
MDKSVLLVLLCLQVFLLITAFTSTDAAAVVRDDQLPPDQVFLLITTFTSTDAAAVVRDDQLPPDQDPVVLEDTKTSPQDDCASPVILETPPLPALQDMPAQPSSVASTTAQVCALDKDNSVVQTPNTDMDLLKCTLSNQGNDVLAEQLSDPVLSEVYTWVFLLITAFTSADAAAVVRDDQLPPDQVERRIVNRRKRYFQGGSYPGGTGLALKKVFLLITAFTSTDAAAVVRDDQLPPDQVFLLITAFTSTDAAAVVRDDQLPPDQVEKNGNRLKRNIQCGYFAGGCGAAGEKVFLLITAFTSTDAAAVVRDDQLPPDQVFLLITAFTSTDAAAVVRDDQLPPDQERRNGNRRKRYSQDGYKARGSGRALKKALLLITAFSSTDPTTLERNDLQQQAVVVVKIWTRKYKSKNKMSKHGGCRGKPGACGFPVNLFDSECIFLSNITLFVLHVETS